jgi:peroxiredoxin Q/BCP
VRDARDDLSRLNVAAVGISPDKPEQQKKFDDKHGLGFPLLSDADHRVAESYGVWGEKSMYGKKFMGIIRSSFLIDEKGKIVKSWYKISPKKTVPELMDALK